VGQPSLSLCAKVLMAQSVSLSSPLPPQNELRYEIPLAKLQTPSSQQDSYQDNFFQFFKNAVSSIFVIHAIVKRF